MLTHTDKYCQRYRFISRSVRNLTQTDWTAWPQVVLATEQIFQIVPRYGKNNRFAFLRAANGANGVQNKENTMKLKVVLTVISNFPCFLLTKGLKKDDALCSANLTSRGRSNHSFISDLIPSGVHLNSLVPFPPPHPCSIICNDVKEFERKLCKTIEMHTWFEKDSHFVLLGSPTPPRGFPKH